MLTVRDLACFLTTGARYEGLDLADERAVDAFLSGLGIDTRESAPLLELSIDAARARLQNGELLQGIATAVALAIGFLLGFATGSAHAAADVPSGTIHEWLGGFISGALTMFAFVAVVIGVSCAARNGRERSAATRAAPKGWDKVDGGAFANDEGR